MNNLFVMVGLCSLLLLSNNPSRWPDVPDPVITTFHYSYGGFDGHQKYVITRTDEGAVLNAVASNGLELYVEPDQPVPADVLDNLLDLVLDAGINGWDGFSGDNNDVMDGYGFWLDIGLQDGASLQAKGYENYPEEYWEDHALLAAYLEELAYTYRTEPEWGVPTYFYLNYRQGEDHYESYALSLQDDGTVSYSHSGTGHGKVTGTLPPSALTDLQETLYLLEIYQWFGFTGKSDDLTLPGFTLRITHTNEIIQASRNETTFLATGRGILPDGFDEKNTALTEYFNALEEQLLPME